MEENCIFCKIIRGKLPSKKVLESENVISFYDIKPAADTHILITPKKHIQTFMDLKDKDKDLVSEMLAMAKKIITEKKLAGKYRISFNGGSLQIVDHVHMHVLGGELGKQI